MSNRALDLLALDRTIRRAHHVPLQHGRPLRAAGLRACRLVQRSTSQLMRTGGRTRTGDPGSCFTARPCSTLLSYPRPHLWSWLSQAIPQLKEQESKPVDLIRILAKIL